MLYEDRSARISILAGRHPPRPDTLKQTDLSALSIKPLANGAGHTFFEQSVFEGEIGHDLLQRLRLAAEILHLVGGRGARRVACRPPGTLSISHSTSTRRCPRADRVRRCSPPRAALPGRRGSSLQLKSVDGSRAECP